MQRLARSAPGALFAALLSAAPAATVATAQSLSPLEALLQPRQQEPLPPDQAFRLTLDRSADATGHAAQWTIAKGYYLYRDKMYISADGRPATIDPPPGETITDAFFGTTQIFRDHVRVPFHLPAAAATIEVRYQGCADMGICYPPSVKKIAYADITPSAAVATAAPEPASSLSQRLVSEQDQIAGQLGRQSLFLTILGFLGIGLLLAFTPCVLPMVPIVSGMITGSGDNVSARRAFVLTLVYVLAMAATYALAGVAIGLSGVNLQAWFQIPAVIGVFAAVFVLLALSMFGLYALRVPAVLQNRLSRVGQTRRGSTAGAAILGSASALIVGPCVTPPLVGTLLFIAQTGSALVGGVALLSLGIGMGIPLLAVGTSLGKWLPRPGPLLERINVFFGVLLLAVAVWLLDRVVTLVTTQLLAGTLLVLAAVYFVSVQRQPPAGWYVWRGLGTAMMIYGVMLLVGAAAGGSGFVAPLKPFVQGAHHAEQPLQFDRVTSLAELQQRLHQAEQDGQPVMLDFYADWCVTCKEMEAFTFNRAAVQAALATFVTLQADVTQNTDEDRALLRRFGVFGPPAILFFDATGRELRQARLVGFVAAQAFIAHLAQVYMPPAG